MEAAVPVVMIDKTGRVASEQITVDEAVLALHGHWRQLHGLALGILGDRDGAQDAVQDVLVAIIRRGKGFDDVAGAFRYARTAVVNNCRSVLRRRITAQKYLRLLPREVVAPAADDGVLLNDGTARVLALFDALPLRQREVVTLRYLDNLTDNEISRILRVSTSTVRSNASRALATLNRTIEGTTS
jgi:RNA polymerase sigma factor (sigma-70 family)